MKAPSFAPAYGREPGGEAAALLQRTRQVEAAYRQFWRQFWRQWRQRQTETA